MKYLVGVLIFVLIQISNPGNAQTQIGYESNYAGQEQREIKSLSAEDITELQRGGGWGLAKAAELNGVPGPAHILEMGEKLDLTEKQKKKIRRLFDSMKVEAVALGEHLIRLEWELNRDFSNKRVDRASLEGSLGEIEKIRARLRFVHLSAHLETPNILTKGQIVLYNRLRGYTEDPCGKAPAGHDPAMWKKHNGCK